MTPERIDDANPQSDLPSRARDVRGHREHTSAMAAFGQPNLAEAKALSCECQRNRLSDRGLVRERQPEPSRGCGHSVVRCDSCQPPTTMRLSKPKPQNTMSPSKDDNPTAANNWSDW